MELHATKARRCVVRHAPARGEFTHAETVYIEPVESTIEGEHLFKVTLVDGATAVPLDHHSTPRMVIEHLWAVLCSVGQRVAADRDYKRMRGELEINDKAGAPLNDPELTRKRLNLDDPAGATVDDDGIELDPQEKKRLSELAYERREHRKTQDRLLSSLDREESHAVARFDIQQKLTEQTAQMSKLQIDFATYMQGVIRKDIDDARSEARVDFVTEQIMEHVGPKVGLLMEGIAQGARTGFGRGTDPAEVVPWPIEVEREFLSQLGLELYGQVSADRISCRSKVPGSQSYRQTWFDHLRLLDNAVQEHELRFSTNTARRLKLWSEGACKTIQVDPRDVPYLTDAKPDEVKDAEEKAQKEAQEKAQGDD